MGWRAEWLKRASPEEIAVYRAKELARVRAWELANPEKVRARKRDPAKTSIYKTRWRAKNKGYRSATDLTKAAAKREETRQKRSAAKIESYKRRLERNKVWHAANKERVVAYKAAWSAANLERIVERARARRLANPDHIKNRRANDLRFAILERLRARMQKALKAQGAVRAKNTKALLGCTPEEFREHIESQFLPGMGWHNRTQWHLDHKLPCAHFDLTDLEQQAKCFHFTNIRPLWRRENQQKSAKVLPEFLDAA